MIDYLIIGAGITGITLSKKLKEKGYNVLVLEAQKVAGGLCRTENINGHILDIGGGHFFHTKHKEVFDFNVNCYCICFYGDSYYYFI